MCTISVLFDLFNEGRNGERPEQKEYLSNLIDTSQQEYNLIFLEVFNSYMLIK